MKIDFGGHEFMFHPSGVLFWPEKSIAIVSDMHLEKGSHFAQKGFFLPPYDTHETLERLHSVFNALSAQQIVVLGDTFHDAKGFSRLPAEERKSFDKLLHYNPIWITGNHDGDFVPPGFKAFKSLVLGGLVFNHEAKEGTRLEISGHYHPKIDILHKKSRISRPCFIEDGNKMILPSFGAYTGGLSIENPVIRKHFGAAPRIYALGEKIYFFKMGEG